MITKKTVERLKSVWDLATEALRKHGAHRDLRNLRHLRATHIIKIKKNTSVNH